MSDRKDDDKRVYVRLEATIIVNTSAVWTQGHTMGQIVDQGRKDAERTLRDALQEARGVSIEKIAGISVVARQDMK